MHDMPRPRLPYLACERNRHGTLVWYFRRGKGARIRLRGDYGSAEFREAYEAALIGNGIKHPTRAKSGSMAWLVAQYRETSAWSSLAPATRRARDNIFSRVIASAGKEEFSAINRPSIMAAMDARKDTPAAYAAESGATEKELDALAGWTDGGKTAQVYTRNASRKILAKEAAEKMWGKAK